MLLPARVLQLRGLRGLRGVLEQPAQMLRPERARMWMRTRMLVLVLVLVRVWARVLVLVRVRVLPALLRSQGFHVQC